MVRLKVWLYAAILIAESFTTLCDITLQSVCRHPSNFDGVLKL